MTTKYTINASALEKLETATFQGMTPDAKWLFLKGYVWCQFNGSRGTIPKSKLDEVDAISPLDVIECIAQSGYWDGRNRTEATLDFLNRVMA